MNCVLKFVCFFPLFLNFHRVNAKEKIATMIIYKVEKVFMDKNFGDYNISVSRITRKDFAISTYFYTNQVLDDMVFVHFHIDALYSNEFRRTPLTVTRNICSFLNEEYAWVKDDLMKHGHVPHKCPIPMDLYYIKNYVLDASRVPQLPWKEIKVNIDIYFKVNNGQGHRHISSVAVYVKNNQDYVKLLKDV